MKDYNELLNDLENAANECKEHNSDTNNTDFRTVTIHPVFVYELINYVRDLQTELQAYKDKESD